MKVLKSWGAAGEVILSLEAEDSRDLKSQEPVFITFDGLPVPFFIESVQPKGNRFVVKFQDIDTLEEAEELVGREATLEGDDAEEDETLVGLQVRDSRTRRVVGEIVDFSDYGGNIVITVETPGGREILLPLHEDLIVSIHDEVVTLDIPDGLIDSD